MKYIIIIVSCVVAYGFIVGDRTVYAKPDFNCAFSMCSQRGQAMIVEAMGGKLPPQYYEYGTKKFWSSFCTYSPDECIY